MRNYKYSSQPTSQQQQEDYRQHHHAQDAMLDVSASVSGLSQMINTPLLNRRGVQNLQRSVGNHTTHQIIHRYAIGQSAVPMNEEEQGLTSTAPATQSSTPHESTDLRQEMQSPNRQDASPSGAGSAAPTAEPTSKPDKVFPPEQQQQQQPTTQYEEEDLRTETGTQRRNYY